MVINMIKWKRPSGTIIETRDDEASKATAKKLGWKRVKKTAPPQLDLEVSDGERGAGSQSDTSRDTYSGD